MRWLVTSLLLVAVAAGVVWLAAGDRLRRGVGLADAPPPPAQSAERLDELARGASIPGLTLTVPGQPPLTLSRAANGNWTQPGNWPLRESEVAALVNALSSLRSRFAVIPTEDFAAHGLAPDDKPVQVRIDARIDNVTRSMLLTVGKPVGESCYVRVDELPEVVRFGPDLYAVLSRPTEVYRRRQLLADPERVKFAADGLPAAAGAGRVAIPGPAVASIRLDQTAPPWSLTVTRTAPTPVPRRDPDRTAGEPGLAAAQLAAAWQLSAPVTDRLDPVKLKALLVAVPDLWVEAFVPPERASPGQTGLDKPARTITVTNRDGSPLTVLIGGEARKVNRVDDAPPRPTLPGQPPPPANVTAEVYSYAKLQDNEQVFELRTDKLADLFAPAEQYRDPLLARFDQAEVTTVVITRAGQPAVTLTKIPGQKDAERDEDKQDRWRVGELPADTAQVTDFLAQLGRVEAKGPGGFREPGDKPPAGTTVAITTRPRELPGEATPDARTLTLNFGPADAMGAIPAQLAGYARVQSADAALGKLLDRPALAYRGRRLFDAPDLTVTRLTVTRPNQPALGLESSPRPAPAKGVVWKLTAPVALDAAAGAAERLSSSFARLEVAEYVDDAPKPEDVAKKYALAEPAAQVKIEFAAGPARTLSIGGPREGKPEVYARLDGAGGVFTLPKALAESVQSGALSLLPPEVWTLNPEQITQVDVARGADAYKLARGPGGWGLGGPFDAPIATPAVDPLLGGLSTLRADRYEALPAGDLARFGLDKPRLTLTARVKDPAKPEPAVYVLRVGGPAPAPPPAPNTPPGVPPPAPGAFAQVEGPGLNPAVFVLNPGAFAAADRPALGWIGRDLLTLDPAKLATIALSGPDVKPVTLTQNAAGSWVVDAPAFPVDAPTANALAGVAARLTVARVAAYGSAVKWADYGLDKPGLTLTLEAATVPPEKPKQSVVQLGKTEPNGERYVRVDNGPAVGVLPRRAAEALARGRLDFADKTLFNFDPALFGGLTRQSFRGGLNVRQSGANWVVGTPEAKADRATLEELGDRLARLRATRVVAIDPPDLAKTYGLAVPVAVVTVKVGDAAKVLKVGSPVDPARPSGERYVQVVEAGRPVSVATIPGSLARELLASPAQFRDKTLAKFVDADKAVLQRGDRKVTFAKVNGTWAVTAPIQAEAEAGELDELVNALATLRASEFAADKPGDLAAFGLANPEAQWTLSQGDKPVLSLKLGAAEKSDEGVPPGRVYAQVAGNDAVVLLDPAISRRVLAEYRKRGVFADLDAAQVETVAVSDKAGGFVLQKAGPTWRNPQKPDEPVDAAAVNAYLAALAGLKVERWVADDAAALPLYGLDQPSRVVVVTQRGGVRKTLQLGGPEGTSGGKRVYARNPDSPRAEVFVVGEADRATLGQEAGAFKAKP